MIRRQFKSTRSSKSMIFLHIIIVTKYRRKVLSSEIPSFVELEIASIANSMDIELQEINGEEDHVHMLIKIPPTVPVTAFLHRIKGATSRLVRERFWAEIKKLLWGDSLWSPSYCVVSAGGASLDVLKQYIENQDRPK